MSSTTDLTFSLVDILKRDKLFLLVSLLLISAISWWYMFYLAAEMDHMMVHMEMNMMPEMMNWDFIRFLLTFVMWFVMMIAMMVPSVTPAVFVFSSVYKKRAEYSKPFVSSWIFLLGYLTIWLIFSFFATVIQWILHETALLSPMMKTNSGILGGIILISCGVFQWSNLKNNCLKHCRSPINFLMDEWRDGKIGAFIMGIRHGLFCVVCCWLLMLLLFLTGVMNLFWIALIALFILIEKIAPKGIWVSRFTGLVLIVLGFWMFL